MLKAAISLALAGVALGAAPSASAATYVCHPVLLLNIEQFIFFVRNTVATPTTFKWTAYNTEGQLAQSSGVAALSLKARATAFFGGYSAQHFPGSVTAGITVTSPSDKLLVSTQVQRNALGGGDEGFQQVPCPRQ